MAWWHLPALVVLMLLVAVTGSLALPAAQTVLSGSRILGEYVPTLVVAWGFVAYVALASPSEPVVKVLLGNRDRGRIATDVAIALAVGLLIVGVESMLAVRSDAVRAAALRALLPQTLAERAVWILVAVSVAFSEELVYRGYLQTRLGALLGSRVLGIVAQAVLFGIAHANQGGFAMTRIAVYGLLLGGTTAWRRSLRPAIWCHGALDAVSGLSS